MINNYFIGPAGWSYKDWEGIVYPVKKGKRFHKLEYISHYFNTVEINSSFYHPPAVKTIKQWIDQVHENPKFLFTYKLWQKYTHHRQTIPLPDEEKLVKSGLDVLLTNNKLGALLIQFPWSFRNTKENIAWLKIIFELFNQYNPVLEVRHNSWGKSEFFDYLKHQNIGYANIDQPVIGDSIQLSAKITGNISYIRFHGRNYDTWFKNNGNGAARYDYLYNDCELNDFTTLISILIENSAKTFIIFNNHYRGQAIANALQTMYLLENKKVYIPGVMKEYYPGLKNIAKIKTEYSQISLFD